MKINIKSSSGNSYLFNAVDNNFYANEDGKNIFDKDIFDIERRKAAIASQRAHDAIDNSAKTLTLETTEQCNLRCSYCTFDESYPHERNHGTSAMLLETAKKAILDFSKRASESDVYIVFYGGEPLLRFKFIVDSCEYARKIFRERVNFSFTTNGTLLTNEKLNFLVKENFLITISLDGDKSTHNKFRVTVKNKNTYDIIKNNLQKIKDSHPEFYYSNIEFNSVAHSFDSALAMGSVFWDDPLTKNSQVRFSFLLQNKKSNEVQVDWIENNKTYIIEQILSGNVVKNKFLIDAVFPTLYNIDIRNVDIDATKGKKICTPFVNRTYVRTNGEQQFCERIGKYGADVNNDIKESSNHYLEEFNKLKQADCMSCYAYNFCQLCPASFIDESGYNLNKLNSLCNINRKSIIILLEIYVDIMEKNPQAIQDCFNIINNKNQ